MKFSLVVPVYNSERMVGELTERAVAILKELPGEFEIILVDDESADGSWDVISALTAKHPEVKGIRLGQNMGQQYVTLCGVRHASGEYVITMDDDLQHSPEDIPRLIEAMGEDCDLAFAVFRKYRKGLHRRFGSRVLNTILRKTHGLPRDFTTSSFRMARRSLMLRAAEFHTLYPHINGIALSLKPRVRNVEVEHMPRAHGRSGYSVWRLTKLLIIVIYNSPRYALRVLFLTGLALVAAAVAGLVVVGLAEQSLPLIRYVPPIFAAVGIFLITASLGGRLAFRIIASKTPMPDYTCHVISVAGSPSGSGQG